jgi:hypothetical protein
MGKVDEQTVSTWPRRCRPAPAGPPDVERDSRCQLSLPRESAEPEPALHRVA